MGLQEKRLCKYYEVRCLQRTISGYKLWHSPMRILRLSGSASELICDPSPISLSYFPRGYPMGEFGEGGCRSPQYFTCLPIDVIFHGFLASFMSKSVFFASPKSSFWANFSYAPPAIPLLLRSCSHLMQTGISYFQLFLALVSFVDLNYPNACHLLLSIRWLW